MINKYNKFDVEVVENGKQAYRRQFSDTCTDEIICDEKKIPHITGKGYQVKRTYLPSIDEPRIC